jgi:NAD(P)-dependent dehydrogenase (short-subunit alcohol dehydrogenase family)
MDLTALPKDFYVTSLQFTKHVYQDQYPSIDPTRPELNLAGKVVIITGASRGVGAKAFAPAFAKAGVKGIALLATNAEKLTKVAEEVKQINPSVNALSVTVDISDTKSVEAAFEKIKSTFGHADILINNAGLNTEGEGQLLGDVEDVESYWKMFEVNSKGALLMSRAFIRQLPSPETPATIVNLATGLSWMVVPTLIGYSLSKLIPLQITAHIAASYPNITAVALHPGLLDTDMLMDTFRHFTLETPELVGGLAVWLSHPHAKFLSGKTIVSQWSVDDLLERKDEIANSSDLTMQLQGKLGAQHYV